jgi:hypothetical protein
MKDLMDKQLLIEMSLFTPTKSLNESLGGSNKMIVEGLIQKAETKNGNGRVYPYEVLKREADKYLQGPVKERRALGELDHPDSPVINLKNVSHNIVALSWQGKDLYGKIEILPTPSGNILRELFNNNITVGISSRGMGSVRQIGETIEVQDDFELMCWDFVSTPSTPGAYMEVVNESISYSKPSKDYSKIDSLITEIICNRTGFCTCDFDNI